MGKGRCGGDEDEDETDAYDPSDKGPNSKRGCTDVPCLLLLAAFIAAWIGVGFYSFAFGNPAQLIHPSNSEGEICGRGVHAKRPYLLFFDLTRCARLSSALSGCATPQVFGLLIDVTLLCTIPHRCVFQIVQPPSGATNKAQCKGWKTTVPTWHLGSLQTPEMFRSS